jgi:DNA-binding response OmpR family regulator
MNVLLVEDDERIVEFVRRGLEAEGHEVDVARSGLEALRRAQARNCQLIILDLLLPDLDGREICRGLRAAQIATPILMLSPRSTRSRTRCAACASAPMTTWSSRSPSRSCWRACTRSAAGALTTATRPPR